MPTEDSPISQSPADQTTEQAPISSAPASEPAEPETFDYECEECHEEGNNPNDFLSDDNHTFCKEHGGKCQNCGNIESSETMRYENSRWYCEDCFNEEFTMCPNCEETIPVEDFYAPTSRNRYIMKSGGCTNCCYKCQGCGRVVDKDTGYTYENEEYCEDCYSDRFTTCEGCSETIANDEARYVNGDGSYCDSCYTDKFVTCEDCGDEIEIKDAQDIDGDSYCESCYDKKSNVLLEEYKPLIDNMSNFSFTKKDRLLDRLAKIVPISVRELKAKHSSLASGLADLIAFSGGKDITAELISKYRESQGVEEFPVEYSTWTQLQRSTETLPKEQQPKHPQLVLKILASSQMLSEFESNKALGDLFHNINDVSKRSTHPYSENQIGWARLELDPNKNFILVDEVQCDHQNAAHKIRTASYGELLKVRSALKNKYSLDDDKFNEMLDKYAGMMKNFADIATQAISAFAKKNGYAKLYWHTYESGKDLKQNSPPKSLYDKTPKDNFFAPTDERPFNLNGKFFSREATAVKRLKIASRLIQIKQLLNNK